MPPHHPPSQSPAVFAVGDNLQSRVAIVPHGHTYERRKTSYKRSHFGTTEDPPKALIDLAERLEHPSHWGSGSPIVPLVPPVIRNRPGKRPNYVRVVARAPPSGASRPRTGNPVVDGLVGIEPNPGPPKSRTMTIKIKKNSDGRANGIGGRNASKQKGNPHIRGAINVGSGRVTAPLSTGFKGRGAHFAGHGTKTVLGSQAHIFSGRCAVQNLTANASNALVFKDAGGGESPFMYLNPRICCQNSSYATPAGNCPIGVIAQAFRKFSFRRLRLTYEPTAANTTYSIPVAYMYDPEVITTSALVSTVMGFANVEASVYGPVWAPSSLDITPWLDKSKWFYGETPANIATSLISSQSIQGTVQVCANNAGFSATLLGMFYMDFELALCELGPTELFSAPALKAPAQSPHDEKHEPALSKDEEKDPDKPVVVYQSVLSKLMGNPAK